MTATPTATKHQEHQAAILGHEVLIYGYPRVAELIARSRAARTLEAHVGIQKELANDALRARHLDRELARAIEETNEARQAALAPRGDRSILPRLDRQEEDHKLTREANARLRYAMRVVQDGIAWRLLNFNRHMLMTLGVSEAGASPTYPSGGFEAECAEAEEHWNEGKLAVLGDLSNVLKTGDVLVFNPPNELIVVEVTTGREDQRKKRQLRRIEAKIDFLNTGRSEVLAPSFPVVAPQGAPKLETHLPLLVELLSVAHERGWACERAGEAMAVYAYDSRGWNGEELAREGELMMAAEVALAESLGWRPDDYKSAFRSVERVEREQNHPSPSTAPYSIFPVDAETAAALSFGWTGYRVLLNLRLLREALERRGWTVEVPTTAEERDSHFLSVKGGDWEMHVSREAGYQLLVELQTVDAFGDLVSSMAEQVSSLDDAASHLTWRWSGEAEVWD